jgi:hypothetical protein
VRLVQQQRGSLGDEQLPGGSDFIGGLYEDRKEGVMPFSAVMAIGGLGISAAGAAGAFNGPVDQRGPTPEEIKAAAANRQAYEQGRFWQQQLDPMMNRRLKDDLGFLKQTNQRTAELGQELRGLRGENDFQGAADRGVNQLWQQMPAMQQGMTAVANRSGGPGSGQAMAAMGTTATGIDAALRGTNAQGRMGYLNEYNQRRNQMGQVYGQQTQRVGGFRDQALSRFDDYRERLGTGLNLVTGGGQQAAANQNARINAQVQNNMATSSAMSSIGGSLMGAGMGMMSAGGGLSGLESGAYKVGDFFGAMV